MVRWARAAMSLSGMKVPLMAQTARRPRIARSAVANGPTPRAPCAPRPGTTATRRPSKTSSVFASRVSLNPRLTLCFSWPERVRCGSRGDGGRVGAKFVIDFAGIFGWSIWLGVSTINALRYLRRPLGGLAAPVYAMGLLGLALSVWAISSRAAGKLLS